MGIPRRKKVELVVDGEKTIVEVSAFAKPADLELISNRIREERKRARMPNGPFQEASKAFEQSVGQIPGTMPVATARPDITQQPTEVPFSPARVNAPVEPQPEEDTISKIAQTEPSHLVAKAIAQLPDEINTPFGVMRVPEWARDVAQFYNQNDPGRVLRENILRGVVGGSEKVYEGMRAGVEAPSVEETQKMDEVQKMMMRMGVLNPSAFGKTLQGGTEALFAGATAINPTLAQITLGSEYAGRLDPGLGELAHAAMAPITTLAKPESEFWKGVTGLADIAAVIKATHLAKGKGKATPKTETESTVEPEASFSATTLPGLDKIAKMDWKDVGELVMNLRTNKKRTKAQNATLAAAENRLSQLHDELDVNPFSETKKGEAGRDLGASRVPEKEGPELVSAYSEAGQVELKKMLKGKGEAENVTEVSPDALLGLSKYGGEPVAFVDGDLVVGRRGQIHYQMYQEYYRKAKRKNPDADAQASMRHNKFLNGRVTDDGGAVALWGSIKDLRQQDVSDMLLELVMKKKLKKDGKVFFAGNEKGGGISVRDAIEGNFPTDFYAGIVPLPDITDTKWGDLVKKVGAAAIAAHKRDEGGSSTNPRTGKPFTPEGQNKWAVSLWSDKLSKTVENKPEAIQEAIAAVMKKSKGLLDKDPDVFIGTWKNDAGQIVVEPSIATSGARAIRLARRYGQDAVFNLESGELVTIPGKLEPKLSEKPMERLEAEKNRSASQTEEVQPDSPEAKAALQGRLLGDTYDKALFEGKVGQYAEAKAAADAAGAQELSPGLRGKGGAPEDVRIQRYVETVEPAFKQALEKDREAAARGEIQFSKWYSKDYYDKHIGNVEKIIDLKEPGAKEIYPFFESLFSVGNSPENEVRFALSEWGKRDKGLFNTDNIAAGSKAAPAILPNLQKLNTLIKENGGDLQKAVDWLKSEHSLAEIKAFTKDSSVPDFKPETGRDVYYGAEVFGPKIGMYGLNKSGFHEMPTIDSWMNRQWIASMNRVSEKMGKSYDAVTKESRPVVDLESKLPSGELKLARTAMKQLGDKYGLNVTEVQALLWGLEKDFAERHGATKVERAPHFVTSERVLNEKTTSKDFGENLPDTEKAGPGADKGGGAGGDGQNRTGDSLEKGIKDRDVSSFQMGGLVPGLPDVIMPDTFKKLKKYAGSVNVMRLADVDEKHREQARQIAQKWADEINKVTGDKVTAEEVFAAARDAEPWSKGVPRHIQVQMFGEIMKLRQVVGRSMSAEQLDTPHGKAAFLHLNNVANFAGRLLRFFREDVEGVEWGTRERMYRRLEKIGHDLNEVVQRGRGVDWENGNEVARFYRTFEKPEGKDLLNELRYISLLSSPRTHMVNAASNLLQMSVMKPATMLTEGVSDWTLSLFNKGRKRENYVSEVPAYARGVTESIGIASKNAMDALLGKRMIEHLDIKNLGRLPSMGEAKNPLLKPLAKLNEKTRFVTNALEAGDVFFRTMIEGGERAALLEKSKKTGEQLSEAQLNDRAAADAAYWIFRKALDPQNKTAQGEVLSMIDRATSGFMEFSRHVPGARWLVPFVQTPMNIFKQGIEFSPLGFFTMKGAGENRLQQFSKAVVGSVAMAGFAMAVDNLETTWDVPSDPDEKADFYAQGKLPFAVKVNGTWVQINKLGPLSYPLSLVLMMKHSGDDKKISTLQAFPAAMIKFFSEQSYVQGMSSFFDMIGSQDNEFVGAADRLTSNLARQVVPLGGLQRWANNFIDRSQRIPDNMLENIARDLPGFSQRLPARKDVFGQEAKKRDLGAEGFQLSPLGANVEPSDPVYTFTREHNIEIGVPPTTVYGRKLTKEEHQRFIEEVGRQLYKVVDSFRAKEEAQPRADWEYQDAIDEERQDITKSVRERLFAKYMKEQEQTRRTERDVKRQQREEARNK